MWGTVPHLTPCKKEVTYGTFTEELQNYSVNNLYAMSDVLVEIIENRATDYVLPAKFLESLDELRCDIDREIEAGLNDMEAFEAHKLALPVGEKNYAHHPCPNH
jgi:hypothetical protein